MIEKLMKNSIKTLIPYEPKEVEVLIKLDANENNNVDYVLNEKIARALTNLKINKYPDSGCSEIKEMLASDLKVSKDQIIIGSGSDQLISMAINTFVDKEDKILTFTPTFMMYKISNQIAGGKTVEVPLEEDFKFNYYSFIKAVKRENPKLIFLTNPNNPTGGVIPREHIMKILEFSNSIVIVDEAYYEFYGESILDLVQYYPNLMVLRTLSKAYGLAGARIGYSVASKALTRALKKTQPPYNVSSLDQLAAKVCLENKGLLIDAVKNIIKERDKLALQLKEIRGIKVYESYGNFILLKLERGQEFYQYLLRNKVLIRYFGEEGPLAGCLRVSVGTGEENSTFLSLLMQFLGGGAVHEKKAV